MHKYQYHGQKRYSFKPKLHYLTSKPILDYPNIFGKYWHIYLFWKDAGAEPEIRPLPYSRWLVGAYIRKKIGVGE